MKSEIAVVGFAGKGLFNSPTKINNVKDLHTSFGKRSDLILVSEQLLYGDHSPIIVRLEDSVQTAGNYLLDDNGTICMMISADSPGFSGTQTTVEVTRNSDSFDLIITNNGEMVEFWGNLKPSHVEEIINLASKWINISTVKGTLPAKGMVNLVTEDSKRPIINLEMVLNAIQHLDVDFILIPDCSSVEIINPILECLEVRKSVLIIDPPWECDLLDTYKWCKSLIPSDYGVIFWPWLNYQKKSTPPSGPIATAILNWPFIWCPVRTKLAGVSDTPFSIHNDELVYISKQEHFINLIKNKNNSLVLDNNILTLAGSKLSERRLLNYIEKSINKLGSRLLSTYNPLSNNFRNNFIESSEYILKQVKEDQGINNFILRVNEWSKPEDFEVNLDIAIKDSTEVVNICFKFTK